MVRINKNMAFQLKGKTMTIWKVETQLRKDETVDTKKTVRYAGVGNVCWRMYVRNEAYEKLGKPDAIRVTIEAMRLDDIQ